MKVPHLDELTVDLSEHRGLAYRQFHFQSQAVPGEAAHGGFRRFGRSNRFSRKLPPPLRCALTAGKRDEQGLIGAFDQSRGDFGSSLWSRH